MLLLTYSTGLIIDHDVHLTTSCPRMLQGVKRGHIVWLRNVWGMHRVKAACRLLFMQVARKVEDIFDVLRLQLLLEGPPEHAGVTCCGCIICSKQTVYLQPWAGPASTPSQPLCSPPVRPLLRLL